MLITGFSSRASLLCAASTVGLAATPPAFAQATDRDEPTSTEQIVANHTVPPGPGSETTGANNANRPQVLSTGVNGVGQQIAFIQTTSPTSAGLSLCTGTLINPRTVITAAHCLSARPEHMYGSTTGTGGGTYGSFGPTQGVPLSFGFNSTNRCLGVAVNGCAVGQGAYEAWRDSGFRTNVALNIYNANQVWYNRNSQSVALGGGGEFANGDIALVTLDTHAKGIPTWALLFSPLEGPAHATITGYGGAGVGLSGIGSLAGIDYRRRAAENMIDALMTNHDWRSSAAIAPGSTASINHQHSIYWLDFDDPDHDPQNLPANFFKNTAPSGQRNNGYYDFNGLGGGALPNEGATAGGDSGGPLIVDRTFTDANGNFIPVVAGVLTGSWSFNGGISTYGQFNVYPPLFPFWEEIVQNNPYVYASAKAGNGDWFDPNHWVQDMDPNFMVIGPDGKLVNALPSTAQGGSDMSVKKFGTLCFLEESCTTFDGPDNAVWDGTSYVTAGGPGSTNFVPNNVEPVNSATPGETVKARYYDVTLREAGTTTLSGSATIDVMTVNGPAARLNIAAGGELKTWADFTQIAGWTNVNGTLNTSDMLVVRGLLSGTGTINADALTVVAGIVAPGGGDKIGTVTVNGDVILASASSLFIDVRKGASDKLAVDGTLSLASSATATDGASIVFNKVTDGAAPRHNESFTIATATNDVIGKFGKAYTFQGVLRPELSYGANKVDVKFVAGKLVEIIDGGSATEIAFASALDQLRSGFYNNLWNLYGSIDWMNGAQLSSALSGLTPRILGDVGGFHDHQSKMLMTTVGDRLSLLGSGKASGMIMTGSPGAALAARNSEHGQISFGRNSNSSVTVDTLPGKMTGFLSGGVERTGSSYGDQNYVAGQGAWHMAMGLELPLGEGRIGTAIGFAEGASSPAGDSNRSRTTMGAAYAAMPVGKGFYVGGIMSAETASAAMERTSHDGVSILRLSGATSAERYSVVAEAGRATDIGSGLSVIPRAQLAYGHYKLDGFSERGGETALQINDLKLSRIEARIGAKLEGTTTFSGVTIKPQLSADYVNLLSGRKTGATVRFAVAPDVPIDLPLGSSASGWAELKGGVTFGDGPVTLGLTGQRSVGGPEYSDQRAQAELKFRF